MAREPAMGEVWERDSDEVGGSLGSAADLSDPVFEKEA